MGLGREACPHLVDELNRDAVVDNVGAAPLDSSRAALRRAGEAELDRVRQAVGLGIG